MRVCIEKSTGRLIESQSHAREGTLIINALNAGFDEADIEEKVVTQGEYQAILDAQPKPLQEPTETEILRDYVLELDYRIILMELGI